ncbi:MAG: 3-deoxy-D-manno-octulosonic acid transferase [Alphaproteobacteria bacterium]
MMLALYKTLGICLTPLLFIWLQNRVRRGKEEAARLGERFGRTRLKRPAGTLVWVHAASVGETQSVLMLLDGLLKEYPAHHILITTGTVTSAALVKRSALPRTIHQYLPSDVPAATRRFLDHWQPNLVLWAESELWPLMLHRIAAHGIPLIMVNGRMSETTFKQWQRLPEFTRAMLAGVTICFAMSEADGARFHALGISKVRSVGNMKYDAAALAFDAGSLTQLAESLAGRPVWVAASTHPGEEEIIIAAAQQLRQNIPDILTIIVPRHASRGREIAALIAREKIPFAQRSEGQAIVAQTAIYLADTMGELGLFYRLSDLVFIGGSLIDHGGHNPLEPARLNCALLSGPHTRNFNEVMAALRAQNAIRIVIDADTLAHEISALLGDDAARVTMAEHALGVVEASQGATSTIQQYLRPWLMGKGGAP